MRGSRRKDIAKYVDETFPFLSKETVHKQRADGVIVCDPGCRRRAIQMIKRNYVKLGGFNR